MYNITSPGNQRPVYDRDGMRFDLAQSDDETFKHRFEYSDAFGSPIQTQQYYWNAFMFPSDGFTEINERWLCQQFKHKNSPTPHSPPLALIVQENQMAYKIRTRASGFDAAERLSDPIIIIPDKWYEFTMDIIWGPRVIVGKDWTPHTRITCNGQVIMDDHLANCYDIEGDLAHRIGPYIWDWGNQTSQVVYARL